jgi:glycosyltransferase involved in cell wall biosynthesis
MKILHVLYQSLPNTAGSSIRSRDLINAQLKNGITPIVITSPFQPPLYVDLKKENIEGVIYYRTFSNNRNEIVAEGNTSLFIQLKKIIHLVKFTRTVYDIAKKENVNLIHAHAMFFCAFAAKYSSLKLNIPFVYEVRSLWEERYKRKNIFKYIIFSIITYLETFSMYCSDRIIVINNALKDNISKRYLIKNKIISIVPNAVDISNIKIIEKKNKDIVFAYIGTLSPIEGLGLLIKVFNQLHADGLTNKLVFYGDGIEKKALELLALNNPLIQFKGSFLPSQASQVYSTVDIVVNPRISNLLTNSVTPLKPLEAMAFRKLVIASDVAGMHELITNEKTGFLFKAESESSLKKIIIDILRNKKNNVVINNAYNEIQENRNWQLNSLKYTKIYNDLINEK